MRTIYFALAQGVIPAFIVYMLAPDATPLLACLVMICAGAIAYIGMMDILSRHKPTPPKACDKCRELSQMRMYPVNSRGHKKYFYVQDGVGGSDDGN